ncbi:hypothetical protein CERZMDRAFT_111987 [Cercospora zeae-maydis SCOH1-5]|uniref:BZIP domain-containing protein n=1 Tax=Cercospora zeae-maydis SCOH1-5 TaxID=717836 RepID=A0A6A6FFS1_9PEZI|nr:hypothetical protein CERZMDRAFT_111987 [Cercospora zeae-maydis SCOH1-5]
MAGRLTKPEQVTPYLTHHQEDLLLAALNSQALPHASAQRRPAAVKRSDSDPAIESNAMTTANGDLFVSPHTAALDTFGLDYTPGIDYLDNDDTFDSFENADMGGELIGPLPGGSEGHDKRKSPDESAGTPEHDSKRQETNDGEKAQKKPGRKPLTSEPTTKRKAQNRAAQRAFRERKEQHLKNLEEKVTSLTKSSEAEKHENGLLRAQVERLQRELREYRKRLSLNSGAVRSSPPLNPMNSQQPSSSGTAYGANFQFDFPKFGALPGSQLFGSQDVSNGNSPGNNGDGSFNDLFSPNLLKSANMNTYFNNNNNNNYNTQNSASSSNYNGENVDNGGDNTSGLNRVFQFNSGSNVSDSTSPSASSNSQWNVNGNGNSSCGTSPEPLHDSPALKDGACGDKSHKPAASSQLTPANLNSQSSMNSMYGFGNADLANPSSVSTFDPVLFGDYRDTNDAILEIGEFSAGFFDDALNSASFDYQSPSNLFGILQSPRQTQATLPVPNKPANAPTPSRNLMAEIQKTCDGGDDDYGLPGVDKKHTDGGKFISCNNLWTQLQSNPDFQEGKFDLDGLCSELRVKAKCSENGVMVDQEHVNAALKKLGKKDEAGKPYDPPSLLFEQDSW